MADRNGIIEKIKALLNKTTANGATEAEMQSALDKASAMMDAYDITDEEVRLTKDEAAILHADPPTSKTRIASSGSSAAPSWNFAACGYSAADTRPGSSALGCRAMFNLQCGCSTRLPTLCSPNCTDISSAASRREVSGERSSGHLSKPIASALGSAWLSLSIARRVRAPPTAANWSLSRMPRLRRS
jgi:uncharacterized protein DUF2786